MGPEDSRSRAIAHPRIQTTLRPQVGVVLLLVISLSALALQVHWTTEYSLLQIPTDVLWRTWRTTVTANTSVSGSRTTPRYTTSRYTASTTVAYFNRTQLRQGEGHAVTPMVKLSGNTSDSGLQVKDGFPLCMEPTHLAVTCKVHTFWYAPNPQGGAGNRFNMFKGSIAVGSKVIHVGPTLTNTTIVQLDRQCRVVQVIRVEGNCTVVSSVFSSLRGKGSMIVGLTWGWGWDLRRFLNKRWHSPSHEPVAFFLWKGAPGFSNARHSAVKGVIGFSETKHFGPQFRIRTDATSYQAASIRHPDMVAGRDWRPTDCKPRWKVAIIIPFRNREFHLWPFLDNMVTFLQTQKIPFTIFVIEQIDTALFNRAALMNVGYLEAKKLGHYDCFVFHDVDMVPEDLANSYGCSWKPRHMSVTRSVTEYRLRYRNFFGGSIMMMSEHIEKINGFPNSFFAWGGEDDEIRGRVEAAKLDVLRYPLEIGRYYSLPHGRDTGNPHVKRGTKQSYYAGMVNFKKDGFNTVNYTLVGIKHLELYEHLFIDLPGPTSKQHVQHKKVKKPIAL